MNRFWAIFKIVVAVVVALVAWNLAFSNGAPASAPIDSIDPGRFGPHLASWLSGSIPRRVTQPGVAECLVIGTGLGLGFGAVSFVRGAGTGILMLVAVFVSFVAIDFGLQAARDRQLAEPASTLNSPTWRAVVDTLSLADMYVKGTPVAPFQRQERPKTES